MDRFKITYKDNTPDEVVEAHTFAVNGDWTDFYDGVDPFGNALTKAHIRTQEIRRVDLVTGN
jgi:hypothetical protein